MKNFLIQCPIGLIACLLVLVSCGERSERAVADLMVRTPRIEFGGQSDLNEEMTDKIGKVIKVGSTHHFILPRCRAPSLDLTWKQRSAASSLEILEDGVLKAELNVGGSNFRVDLGNARNDPWVLSLKARGGDVVIEQALVRETITGKLASSLKDGTTQPNVLLLIIDTLRADHLGCYGAASPVTDALDSIAASGLLYEDATSQANGTLSSISSILSGVYPFRHGVYNNWSSISQDWETLPELLKHHGFSTGAVVGAHHLNPDISGFGQGFDYFSQCWTAERPADEVVGDALHWLDNHKEDRFFLMVHLFDPHSPFSPPEWLAERYYIGDPTDPMKDTMHSASFPPKQREYLQTWLKGVTDFDYPVAMYAAEVDFASRQAGRLFHWLSERGLIDDTLVIVTADHGQSLTEHGILLSHAGMYQQVIRVPLFIRLPGVIPEGERIADPVENFGIYPTVAELLRLPLPRHIESPALPLSETAYEGRRVVSEAGFEGSMMVRQRRWKLISKFKDDYYSEAGTELYDLDSDPSEETNLALRQEAIVDSLTAVVVGLVDRKKIGKPAAHLPLDQDQRQMLEVLGYVE